MYAFNQSFTTLRHLKVKRSLFQNMEIFIKQPALKLTEFLNETCKDVPPAKIILITAGASFVIAYIYGQLMHKVIKNEHFLKILS